MDTFLNRKSEGTHLALDPLSEACDFCQIQWIKSQKWRTLTGSIAYHCVVPSFSYWIVLNVLAAIQFWFKGEWWNFPYLTVSPAFLHRECPEGLSE